ncbi:VPLPA-CTERM sorting domain-containing protein [Phaeobacter sp. 22II1-1F12B]|uniref:VPLPA-CTERM sorting domain-containing protein n=1 Tax=Phaeobacter sp. 22II1-1F12B TaxID=1317111 RepID=UPI000B5215A9|nr:VPLPA-CTERM sorting domain-containing protein [Phaeobacter sp. 22II1-1F12B]OWU71586.1 hypothetical protein ATO1_23110 [Phaeobacter sp. 22II1-1F12B]
MGKLFLIAALSLVASGASASIVNIDISLRIDRIYWSGLMLDYIDDDGIQLDQRSVYDKGEILPEFNQALDLDSFLPTKSVGDIVNFKATIDNDGGDFGLAPLCHIGSYDCSFNRTEYSAQANASHSSFYLAYDTFDLAYFSGQTAVGSQVTFQWADDWGGGLEEIGGSKDLRVRWSTNHFDMTVVSNNLEPSYPPGCEASNFTPSKCQPAVMPLPSSLGFLLTGFLGLAATQARRFKMFNRSNRKHA